jgi:tetratricopeptide (TPR) repeat protein
MNRTRWMAPWLLAAQLGCARCHEPPPPVPSVAAAPAGDARARALALRKPDGDSKADQAVAALQTRLAARPEKAELWLELGRAWIRKARDATDPVYYLNADACAEVALGLEPSNPQALDLRGLVLLNDHRFEEARQLAQGAVAKQPESPTPYGILSDSLLELGRYEESVAAAQKMVDLKPNLPSYSRASYLMWLRGDVSGALESARLAIDAGADHRDPEPRAWELVQAALIFWHKGDYPGAQAGFERALLEFPGYPPALVGQAQVALAQGEPKRAVPLLEQAFAASPLVSTAWLLGDARAAAGDSRGAEEAYARVVKDGRRGDKRTLASYFATKDLAHDEALQLIEAERKNRDDLYTEDAYAWCLYRAGRKDDARAASDRATRLHTPDARLLYHAGAIRLAQGEADAGRALIEQALKLNPSFDPTGAPEARALIEPKH